MLDTLAVIPARLASTRLPRKLLLRETGKYLVQHTWERVRQAKRVSKVVIATDSQEIQEAAASFGAEALMTRPDHESGTDRVAEAARALRARGEAFDLVVDVQGDEPELDPTCVDRLVELMDEDPSRPPPPMGTLAEPIEDPFDLDRPQVVKVVLDRNGWALYFSRSPIPAPSALAAALQLTPPGIPLPIPGAPPPLAPRDLADGPIGLRHIGIYAFRPDFLELFCRLGPAPLERRERLEQLRALYHGHRVRVGVVPRQGARGVDTPEDYRRFLERARARTPAGPPQAGSEGR